MGSGKGHTAPTVGELYLHLSARSRQDTKLSHPPMYNFHFREILLSASESLVQNICSTILFLSLSCKLANGIVSHIYLTFITYIMNVSVDLNKLDFGQRSDQGALCKVIF